MHLNRKFHIAFLGIGLATASKIQEAILQYHFNSDNVVWTTISDPQMDVLLVDREFADAQSVLKVLSYHPVPVLKVDRQPMTSIQLVDDVLYLPIHHPEMLSRWLTQQVLLLESQADHNQPIHQPLQYLDMVYLARLLSPQTGLVKLMSQQGMLGIADTTKEQIWLLPQMENFFLDQTFSLTYATTRELSQLSVIPQDLRQWLWNAIWLTSHPIHALASDTTLRLRYWPQPQSIHERRQILQLVAQLQQRPCTLAQLQQMTHWSQGTLERFAHAMLLTGFAEKCPPVQIDSTHLIEEDGGWRRLFGKLRRHLGL